MDTRQLEYIVAIAETGSLSVASEKLFITQSALSQQLAKLKEEGLPPLFKEEKRKMVLTDAGKIYLNGARAILRTEQLALQKLNSLSVKGSIVFNLSVAPYLQSIVYLNILPELKKQFPNISIHVHTNNTVHTRAQLENGSIDMALIPDIYQQRDFFTYTHVIKDELVLVSHRESETKEELRSLPITIPAPDSFLRELCDRLFSNTGHMPEIYAETDDFNLTLTLVKNRLSRAILPKSLVKDQELMTTPFEEQYFFYLTSVHKKTAVSPVIDAAVLELKKYFYSI